jgi:hypothetical protein
VHRLQAGDHAGEIEQRLRMPCATLVLAKDADPVVPAHVRVLLTTAFHRREVARLARRGVAMQEVPIELSAACARRSRSAGAEPVLFGLDRHVIGKVAEDLAMGLGRKRGSAAQRGGRAGRSLMPRSRAG